MDKFTITFIEEAEDLLAELEMDLLKWQVAPDDPARIGNIFRVVHTIKGSGAMFGFDELVRFAHQFETALDAIRDGRYTASPEFIELSLGVCDHLNRLIQENPPDACISDDIIASLYRLIPLSVLYPNGFAPENPVFETMLPAAMPPAADAGDGGRDAADTRRLVLIDFTPFPEIFESGNNPLFLLKEVQQTGGCQIFPEIDGIPPLKELDPERCYLRWDIEVETFRRVDDIRDIFAFVDDLCELRVWENDAPSTDPVHDNPAPFSERSGGLDAPLDSGTNRQQARRSRLRVSSRKLDLLVDLVGELVTVQAGISRNILAAGDADSVLLSEQLEQLVADLREAVISVRMQPVALLFTPFKRFVHDFSQELGKKAVLDIRGGDTELDKTVLERLKDPILHIFRNSLDHGIEHPQQRREAGKPETGHIVMAAEYAGSQVLIRISDDGKGIDTGAVRRRAEKSGLLDVLRRDQRQCLTEEFLLGCIFSPGFSTAEKISDVSGRGVGMDVVRERIEELGGDIRLSSKPGQGTTVTLLIPMTLAIISGLLIRVGETFYVIPMADVSEVMEITDDDENGEKTRRVIGIREELVPWIRLEELFRLPPSNETGISCLVIMGRKDERVGFLVDEVMGEHQTVIRPLEGLMRHSRVFSGFTILPDGKVALILDIRRITDVAEAESLVYTDQPGRI